MGYELPKYTRKISPIPGKMPQIGLETISSMRHTNAVVGQAMQTMSETAEFFIDDYQKKKEEKRQALLTDQLANLQVGVYSATQGHFDALRDNPDPETYHNNLNETFTKIESELLPTITDPKANAAAVRFLNKQRAEAAARTENIADEVRRDNRNANLDSNIAELIRVGRIDRIEPLITAARASNDITATQAEKIRQSVFETATKENYAKLKDSYLAAAQEMEGEGGLVFLLDAKNTPGLEAEDRTQLQTAMKTTIDYKKSMDTEKLETDREADRDAIYKAINSGKITFDMIDKSHLDEKEQTQIWEKAQTHAKNKAEAKDLNYKVSDSKVELETLQKIDSGKIKKATEIYALSGKGLSIDDTIFYVDRFNTAQKNPTNETVKSLLSELQGLANSGYFIYGQDELTDDGDYKKEGVPGRLQNQRVFAAIHKEFKQWADDNPQATDEQLQTKFQALVAPTKNDVAIGFWQWADRQEKRNKKQWENVLSGQNTAETAQTEIDKLPDEYKAIWERAKTQGATPEEFLKEVGNKWTGKTK